MRPPGNALAALALLLLAACQPPSAAGGIWQTATPFKPARVTPTPFLPAHPTLTPVVGPAFEMDFHFQGIDFSPGAGEITLRIQPATETLNHGAPIEVTFLPADSCLFGDHQACVYHFQAGQSSEVIWISVHSGVGGEGQQLRHALEGTGINSAGLELEQVQQNLKTLEQAEISLRQGQEQAAMAAVIAAARVPALDLADYLALPVDRALEFVLQNDSDVWQQAQTARTTLVIETCGWRIADEAGAGLVTDTSASIYLMILQ